ncbi:MAG: magnesium transporter [Dehalococcoidia bacterium]|nr:magnesium transporter [Dehalococcoidia bacterium]
MISLFKSTIARVAIFAMFLSVIAGQRDVAGAQTLTLAIRSMARVRLADSGPRLMSRELLLGLIHGLLLAVAYVWKGAPLLSAVVGAAMLGSMVAASIAEIGVSFLPSRFNKHPTVSSTTFVATLTDGGLPSLPWHGRDFG